MAKHLVIGINWYGPYTKTTASEVLKDFEIGGLYLAIGRRSGKGNHKSRPQYMGISTSNPCRRCVNPAHHKLRLLDRGMNLWLGEIATSAPAGKSSTATPSTLRYAEWLHVRFMDLPLNERKKTLPPKAVTVVNRWYRPDYDTPRYHRPHPEWPDLIDFAGEGFRARKVWFGGRQVVYSPAEMG